MFGFTNALEKRIAALEDDVHLLILRMSKLELERKSKLQTIEEILKKDSPNGL